LPDRAWRTLRAVQSHRFRPGDVIHFRRGSTWSGGLTIDDAGAPDSPISFTTYGQGKRPVITNPGNRYNRTVGIEVEASWIIVEGLLIRDVYEAGIHIADGANHNIIRDVEITNAGGGVGIDGQHNLVTRCYIHDLNMIINTPGGNNDYGAVGVWIYDSYNEVSYNRMVNCKASCYDYGTDGGAVEWWSKWGSIEGSYVHHNWSSNNNGFLEVGSRGGTVRDNMVAYNVSVNDDWFALFSLTGSFATQVHDFRIENNTIIQQGAASDWSCCALVLNGRATPDAIMLRNNIFYLENWSLSHNYGFGHQHNIYSLHGKAELGLTPGVGEIEADPRFVDRESQNYHLRPDSPAIDAGLDLGHPRDHAGHPVPVGRAPDIGAFEYVGAPTPTATPLANTPTPTPTRTPTVFLPKLIVDNLDPGFATVSQQDAWSLYVSVNEQHYGSSHVYNPQAGTGADLARWSFSVPLSGQYEVFAWWWADARRPRDVPYTINHRDGSTIVRVDQRTDGGQWNSLGIFDFEERGFVLVSDDVAEGGVDIAADAIQLVYIEPAGPTPEPRPTQTPTQDTSTLVGAVDLQGRPSLPHRHWRVMLEVALSQHDAPHQQSFSVETNDFGKFTLTEIPPGKYDIRVKQANTLANLKQQVEIRPGTNNLVFGTLLAGDCNDDNQIDIFDFSLLGSVFDTDSPIADLNNNGRVELLDFSLLRKNFGQQGDIIVP
jgi:hypothetical protein